MKTLKLFTFLILFATLTVNATNAFHKVSSDNDEFSSFDAIVIDGTLFFTDKNLFLWMSDGTLQGTNRMEVNGNGIKYSGIGYIDETMFEFNNQLVYLNNTDNKMYTTDGVTHTKVSDTQVFQFYPMARDNRLFAFTLTDGKLLVIDNSGSESEYDLGFMGDISKSLCVFDDGDFTLFNADKMYRILNGEILQEDLDFQLGTFKFEYKHDNSCY